jgi:putative polyhydroxyalkanoate system protein
MPTITVTERHGRDPTTARQAVEEVFEALQAELGGSYAWEGEALRFKSSGLGGTVRVDGDHVTVQVDIGLAMLPLRGRIEGEIRRRLADALA